LGVEPSRDDRPPASTIASTNTLRTIASIARTEQIGDGVGPRRGCRAVGLVLAAAEVS